MTRAAWLLGSLVLLGNGTRAAAPTSVEKQTARTAHRYDHSVVILPSKVFPALRRLAPTARLTLVGSSAWPRMAAEFRLAHPGADAASLAAHAQLVDLGPLLASASAVVAPVLVQGTGVSTKVLMSLERGESSRPA